MQFKDAAYQTLTQAGEPLHYNEITINRYFYGCQPLTPLGEIEVEIKQLEAEIMERLKGF
jgi:hypothetical protein